MPWKIVRFVDEGTWQTPYCYFVNFVKLKFETLVAISSETMVI
jgi:hypothetical protein